MSVKYEHLVAGLSGGAVSTLILHPFDLLKIRFAGKENFEFLHHICATRLNLMMIALKNVAVVCLYRLYLFFTLAENR